MTVTAKPNIRVEKHLVWRSKDLVELIIGRTPMMWTDLHRGHLARMKKCISTETGASPENAQCLMIEVCGIPNLFLVANGIVRSKLR
jgi:hypothetical protein